jgi:hypothetical protein
MERFPGNDPVRNSFLRSTQADIEVLCHPLLAVLAEA